MERNQFQATSNSCSQGIIIHKPQLKMRLFHIRFVNCYSEGAHYRRRMLTLALGHSIHEASFQFKSFYGYITNRVVCTDGILYLWKNKTPTHVRFYFLFLIQNLSKILTINQLRRYNNIFIVNVSNLCLLMAFCIWGITPNACYFILFC